MTQPTPLERKRALGDPGKRGLPAYDETFKIEPTLEIPEAPSHLGEHGLEAWQRIWGPCRQWISAEVDIGIVRRYCEAVDDLIGMRAILRDEGYQVDAPGGAKKAHPMIKAIRDVENLLTKYEGLMGLTPSDRARLGLAEIRKVDALESFLNKKNDTNKRAT